MGRAVDSRFTIKIAIAIFGVIGAAHSTLVLVHVFIAMKMHPVPLGAYRVAIHSFLIVIGVVAAILFFSSAVNQHQSELNRG